MPVCMTCNSTGTFTNPLFVQHPSIKGKEVGCASCLGLCPNCGAKTKELVICTDEDGLTWRMCAECAE